MGDSYLDLSYGTINMVGSQFPQSPAYHSKTSEWWKFYRFIKVKVHFQRKRELTWVQVKKEGPAHSAIVFIPHNAELSRDPISPAPASYAVYKGWMLLDLVWGTFDLLVGLGQDNLFAWWRDYIVVGWRIGNIPSLLGSEQPKLVMLGEEAWQWGMARGFWV